MKKHATTSPSFTIPVGEGRSHEWFARSAAHYLSGLRAVDRATVKVGPIDKNLWSIVVYTDKPKDYIMRTYAHFSAGFDACSVLLRTITEGRGDYEIHAT